MKEKEKKGVTKKAPVEWEVWVVTQEDREGDS